MNMEIIFASEFGWWSIVILCFLGYFVMCFGEISNGTRKGEIKVAGTLLTTISFILMAVFFGFLALVGLLLFLWIVITPIVKISMHYIERGLFPERVRIRRKYAEKLNVSESEVERISQMNDEDFLKDMQNKYKWLKK